MQPRTVIASVQRVRPPSKSGRWTIPSLTATIAPAAMADAAVSAVTAYPIVMHLYLHLRIRETSCMANLLDAAATYFDRNGTI